MKVSWLSGNCPNYPRIQIPFASEPTSNRTPHHIVEKIHHTSSTLNPHTQFHCSHTLNFFHSTRVSLCYLHITSWSSSPSPLHANFMAIRENKFGFYVESNQGFSSESWISYPPHYHLLLCAEFQTWHIPTSLVQDWPWTYFTFHSLPKTFFSAPTMPPTFSCTCQHPHSDRFH